MAPVVREEAIEAKSSPGLGDVQHGRNARGSIVPNQPGNENMTLQPLLDASLAIQLHAVAAVLAFVLGGMILFGTKGDRLHRLGGRIWVGLMLAVCLSSFFIHTIRMLGPWSPIHLLSVTTIAGLARGVWLARQREIIGHRRIMQMTYVGALLIAGFFTFLPGRIMYEVFFGGPQPMAGVALAAAIIVGGAMLAWRGMRKPAGAQQAAA